MGQHDALQRLGLQQHPAMSLYCSFLKILLKHGYPKTLRMEIESVR